MTENEFPWRDQGSWVWVAGPQVEHPYEPTRLAEFVGVRWAQCRNRRKDILAVSPLAPGGYCTIMDAVARGWARDEDAWMRFVNKRFPPKAAG